MSGNAVEKTRVGVLVDPAHVGKIQDASWRGDDAIVEVADSVEDALGRLLEHNPDVVVTAGDDAFISRVVSSYNFARELKRHPLRIYPAAADGSTQVAAELGSQEFAPKLVRRLVRAARADKLRRQQIDTLKVVVSSEPSARLGFSFGAGIFYRLFEAYKRAQMETSARMAGTLFGLAKTTLLEGGRNLEPVNAKISVDGAPFAEKIGYLVCSTLSETWLGLSMATEGAHAGYRIGERGSELIKKVASSRALPRFVRSDLAEGFERIDVDWSSGFVLDGELVEPGGPHALRVETGPATDFVTI